MRLNSIIAIALLSLGLCLPGLSAAAEDPKQAGGASLSLELNRVEAVEKVCRTTFVVRNGVGVAIKDLVVELVLFDKNKQVLKFLTVSTGALPVAKVRALRFDLKDVACDQIGQMLLNDVKRCEGKGLKPARCLAAVKLSSRAEIPFEF